jgi:hypothetical protein
MTDSKIVPLVTTDDEQARIPTITDAIAEKLADAMTPGYAAEFDPEEAEKAGAFQEDALTEEDAIESAADLTDEG